MKNPKLTDAYKVGILAGTILFVIKGLRSGSITSKLIMMMDDKAASYEMSSLEDELWKALNKCGIKEVKKTKAPTQPAKGAS